jgi:hypothetical protein
LSYRPLDTAEREAVVAWLATNSPQQCPPVLFMSSAQIRRLLEDAVLVAEQRAKPPGPSTEVLHWHALYKSGLSMTAVAARVGRSTATVREAFKRHKLARRPRGSRCDLAA